MIIIQKIFQIKKQQFPGNTPPHGWTLLIRYAIFLGFPHSSGSISTVWVTWIAYEQLLRIMDEGDLGWFDSNTK